MDIIECMTGEEIREVTLDEEHLSTLTEFIHCGWPSTKAEVYLTTVILVIQI